MAYLTTPSLVAGASFRASASALPAAHVALAQIKINHIQAKRLSEHDRVFARNSPMQMVWQLYQNEGD
jgi:hypothetical protein